MAVGCRVLALLAVLAHGHFVKEMVWPFDMILPPPKHLAYCASNGTTTRMLWDGSGFPSCNPPSTPKSLADRGPFTGQVHQCAPVVMKDSISQKNTRVIRDKADTGTFHIDSCHGAYPIDVHLATAIGRLVVTDGGSSVLELGAGCGCYTHFLHVNFGLEMSAYDGVPGIGALSGGLVHHADLSKPLDLGMHDWVLCTEVAEHLPAQYEDTFLATVTKSARLGLVFSWDYHGFLLNHAHVNPRSHQYVIKKFRRLGWQFSQAETEYLKSQAGRFCCRWLRENIMVFRPAPPDAPSQATSSLPDVMAKLLPNLPSLPKPVDVQG